MARPRTPTNILDARGAFTKNPGRRRMDPQTTGKLKPSPRYFTDELKSIWREIVRAAPHGVITQSDRFALEIAVHLVSQFREDPIEFPAARLVRLEILLGKLGMTPADRAKVAAPARGPRQENPFADL